MFYTLEHPEHAWGDYYDILLHGMCCDSDDPASGVELERTGPFVPPISLAGFGTIVVTAELRKELELSGLRGLEFRPVTKKRIVQSGWHTWDGDADEPAEYPENGEPEGYILGGEHSQSASTAVGDLWALALRESATVVRIEPVCSRADSQLVTESWNGDDLFMARGVGYIYATENARRWLIEHAEPYVDFEATREHKSG